MSRSKGPENSSLIFRTIIHRKNGKEDKSEKRRIRFETPTEIALQIDGQTGGIDLVFGDIVVASAPTFVWDLFVVRLVLEKEPKRHHRFRSKMWPGTWRVVSDSDGKLAGQPPFSFSGEIWFYQTINFSLKGLQLEFEFDQHPMPTS